MVERDTELRQTPPAGGYRILLVDDEAANLQLLERALHRDFQTETFLSADAALTALDKGASFDLALVDQRMPGMLGIDFLSRVRKTHPRMMRLLLTAYTETEDLIAAINCGEVYRYIVKPWSPNSLHVEINQALKQYELEHQRDQLLEELARANNALRSTNVTLDEQVRSRTRKLADTIDTLHAVYERFALAIRGANDGLWDWDIVSNTIDFSSRWKSMLGYEIDEVGNDPSDWLDRIHPDDRELFDAKLKAHSKGTDAQLLVEHRMLHKDGEYRWVLCRGVALRDREGQPLRLAGSQTDLTEHGVLDRLTGLPTRSVFLDRLAITIERARRRTDRFFAVLSVDVDRFKVINKLHGRPIGDLVLKEIAKRIKRTFRLADTVGHFGADHFAVLLDEIADVSDSLRAVERMRATVECPVDVDGCPISIDLSVGIAVSTSGYERASDMLADAETARRQAQGKGGRCSMIFDEEVNTRSVAQLQLDQELREALVRDEFRVFFQPVVSLATERVVGMEALIRWQHPTRGLVPPMDFIPLAEKTGFISEIDNWVMFEACRRTKELQESTGIPLTVSVNVSGRVLHQHVLIDKVEGALRQSGLEASRLTLEITETALIEDVGASQLLLSEIKRLGIRLALDDFGTGYSSLGYLNRFPVDIIKVDRSFVSNMENERHTVKIVQSIVTLANSLGKDVTAEGVETQEHLVLLRDMGCQLAQGFYFSKPIPIEALRKKLLDL